MKRSIWMCALLLASAGALAAQQASQGAYEGTSNPPPDEQIRTEQAPLAKPSPAHPMNAQPASGQGASQGQSQPSSVDPALNYPAPTDDGMVEIAPDSSAQPTLNQRDTARDSALSDPDGDIVHPAPLPPGTLGYGTLIRARLMDQLSTAYSQDGDPFRATVVSDVLQDGQVVIPAGAEINGTVTHVSTGHLGGHGSMLLHPQTVILSDGSKFQLYAQVEGTPGSRTRVGTEGQITPGSRLKKDGIEYGGGVGVGVVAGGILGGPAGALAGTIVGASAVTVHLLMDHPQATLETGTVLMFSLTEPLHLEPAAAAQVSGTQRPTQENTAIQ